MKPLRREFPGGKLSGHALAHIAYLGLAGALILSLPGIAEADALYTTEFYQGAVVRINMDGSTRIVATGLSNPEGIAADSSGNLFVALQTQGVIDRITSSGTVIPFVTTLSGYRLSGLTFDAPGNLYVAASSTGQLAQESIFEYNSSGGLVNAWRWSPGGGLPVQPTGLAFNQHGTLFITDYSGNGLYSMFPSQTPTLVTGMGINPLGLAFDSQGNLFIANNRSGTIAERALDGTISTFSSGLDNPAGLAYDNGYLYTANSPNGGTGTTITRVAPDGSSSVFASGLNEPLYLIAVPEPATMTLMPLGLILIARLSRRQSA